MASALLRPALAQFRPWLPGPPWLASSEVSSGPSGGGGSGSKLCPMGTLQPGPGPPPPTRGTITLHSLRSAPPGGPLRQPHPQRAPLACTPHPTPPGYILLPQIPLPGKFYPRSWGPRCQRWVSAASPRPAPAPTAGLHHLPGLEAVGSLLPGLTSPPRIGLAGSSA